MERRLLRNWAWAKWRCMGCDSTLGFSMKRRILIAAVFAPLGGVIGFMTTSGVRFGSMWVWLLAVISISIAGTILAMKLEGIVVVEPRGLFCEGCGYNLTGNTTGACPECGRVMPIAPAVATSTVPVAKPLPDNTPT